MPVDPVVGQPGAADREAVEFVRGRLVSAIWPPDALPGGSRVVVVQDADWAGPWRRELRGVIGAMGAREVVRHPRARGGELEHWVVFDEPQYDSDGNGPYRKALIWERYLHPEPNLGAWAASTNVYPVGVARPGGGVTACWHARLMNDDEEKTVAVATAKCAERADLDRWGLIMRYGRLFTPNPQAGRGLFPDRPAPDNIARNAYQRAMDLGLLYAEGYVSFAGFLKFSGLITMEWAWCLDGESVVDPELSVPATAYFGVAVWPGYARRVHEARQRYREGRGEHTWIFAGGYEAINPPLDPAADLVSGLGRDIGPAARERALAAIPDKVPLAGPYARFVIRRVSWNDTGMALVCNGPGGAFTDDADILGVIQDGDSVATLMRMADEHRPQCEREPPVAGEEAGKPAWRPAEARLQSAGRTFAVLRRLDYNVWDAWLRPAAPGGEAAGVRVTRNGVSYEMACAAVFRAMGAAMPAHFTTVYAGEQPDPPAYPEAFVPTYEVWVPPESRLPMSYERHMIRNYGGHGGMTLFESGQTGGTHSRDGSPLADIGDGTSLAALIQVADEKRPISEWTSCPDNERRNPELTVQKNAEVDLCWGLGGEAFFAALHRLADGTWDAWLTPSHVPAVSWGQEPTELLTPAGVSYEMALAAVVRTMGEDMPTEFGLNYLNERITPGLAGPT